MKKKLGLGTCLKLLDFWYGSWVSYPILGGNLGLGVNVRSSNISKIQFKIQKGWFKTLKEKQIQHNIPVFKLS